MKKLIRKTKKIIKEKFPSLINKYRVWGYKIRFDKQSWDRKLEKTLNLLVDIEKNPYEKIKPKKYQEPNYSKFAILEINNTCNLNCAMCQTMSATRQRGRMGNELLNQILHKLSLDNIEYLALHTLGDPLANPRLPEVMHALREFNMMASICTNGLLLERHLDTLLEYLDICPSISFSVDGATKETYEKIRIGGNFETLIEQLELSNEKLITRGMAVKIHCCLSKDNIGEVGKFIRLFSKYVLSPAHDMTFSVVTGLAPDNTYFNKVNLFPNFTHKNLMCFRPGGDPLWINVDGTVSACCRDYHGELVIGDIKKKTYRELQHSKGLKKLQVAHESNNLKKYPPCDDCFRPDKRLDSIVNSLIQYLIYKHPSKDEGFYQNYVEEVVSVLQSKGEYAEKIKSIVLRH